MNDFHYHVTWSNDEKAYVATVDEFSLLVATASTEEDALIKLRCMVLEVLVEAESWDNEFLIKF